MASCPIKTLGQEASAEGKTDTHASKNLRKLNHAPDRISSMRANVSSVMARRRGRIRRSWKTEGEGETLCAEYELVHYDGGGLGG